MSVLLWLRKMYKHVLKSQMACEQSRLSFCALKPYYANDIKVLTIHVKHTIVEM